MIAQASEGSSSCIMHLPAQYECMPSGAEKEDGLSGGSHTGYTWNDEKTHGAGWAGGGTGGEKEEKKKMKRANVETDKAKRKRAAEEEKGV